MSGMGIVSGPKDPGQARSLKGQTQPFQPSDTVVRWRLLQNVLPVPDPNNVVYPAEISRAFHRSLWVIRSVFSMCIPVCLMLKRAIQYTSGLLQNGRRSFRRGHILYRFTHYKPQNWCSPFNAKNLGTVCQWPSGRTQILNPKGNVAGLVRLKQYWRFLRGFEPPQLSWPGQGLRCPE